MFWASSLEATTATSAHTFAPRHQDTHDHSVKMAPSPPQERRRVNWFTSGGGWTVGTDGLNLTQWISAHRNAITGVNIIDCCLILWLIYTLRLSIYHYFLCQPDFTGVDASPSPASMCSMSSPLIVMSVLNGCGIIEWCAHIGDHHPSTRHFSMLWLLGNRRQRNFRQSRSLRIAHRGVGKRGSRCICSTPP